MIYHVSYFGRTPIFLPSLFHKLILCLLFWTNSQFLAKRLSSSHLDQTYTVFSILDISFSCQAFSIFKQRTFTPESWKSVNELIHGQISCTTHIHFHFNSTCFLFLNTSVCTPAEFYLLTSGIPSSTLHWHFSYSHSLSKWYPWHHQIWRAKIFANLFAWTNLFPFFCGFGEV